MINAVQLSLFAPQFPDWKEVNTKWVFDYLSALYPEMKFICEEIQDGFDNTSYIVIKQTAFKVDEWYELLYADNWNDDTYSLAQLYFNTEGEENFIDKVEVIGNIYENTELLEVHHD